MARATPNARDALAEGLVDAAGFLLGALAGWQLGRLLGFDILSSEAGAAHTAIAWALLLGGCGLGKWVSLQWRARRDAARD
ncbi:MAG: hypothetical protein Q7U26_17190 [Aquabacterium sp.]|nr:hypothetical protein [Aquabacterium sp.]